MEEEDGRPRFGDPKMSSKRCQASGSGHVGKDQLVQAGLVKETERPLAAAL